MLSFILLLWFALCVIETVFWLCIKRSTVHLLLFCRHVFADQFFPRLPLLFFSPTMFVMSQYDASGFLRSCCVEWFLTLACPEIVPFALQCCLSYICFWCALRLIEQVMRRIQRCQLFFLCQHLLDLYGFLQWLVLDANFRLAQNISKRTSQKHKTKLLKHLKDTDQTSYTCQRHKNKLLKHQGHRNKTSQTPQNCVTKASHTCTSW